MRTLLVTLLFVPFLTAQDGGGLDLHTDLGTPAGAQIRLVPPGCWDGLVLGASVRPPQPSRRNQAGATVEVWDLAIREAPRREAFTLYLKALGERLAQAFMAPPPSHGKIELNELVQSDPSSPQKLDLIRVESMQQRFNPPPRLAPVRE
ncbi:hypothetical protein [Geothrix campi]|uniref:hypothetical protein n=1 Tax=Geothrix campi TaxID=2966450 RepID=UPI0021488B1C|nr:hypothetical protein [Geothrix sp. SG10]